MQVSSTSLCREMKQSTRCAARALTRQGVKRSGVDDASKGDDLFDIEMKSMTVCGKHRSLENRQTTDLLGVTRNDHALRNDEIILVQRSPSLRLISIRSSTIGRIVSTRTKNHDSSQQNPEPQTALF